MVASFIEELRAAGLDPAWLSGPLIWIASVCLFAGILLDRSVGGFLFAWGLRRRQAARQARDRRFEELARKNPEMAKAVEELFDSRLTNAAGK